MQKHPEINRDAFLFGNHILCKYAIPSRGIVDKDVGNGSDKFAVLNDRASRHKCVNTENKPVLTFRYVSAKILHILEILTRWFFSCTLKRR